MIRKLLWWVLRLSQHMAGELPFQPILFEAWRDVRKDKARH